MLLGDGVSEAFFGQLTREMTKFHQLQKKIQSQKHIILCIQKGNSQFITHRLQSFLLCSFVFTYFLRHSSMDLFHTFESMEIDVGSYIVTFELEESDAETDKSSNSVTPDQETSTPTAELNARVNNLPKKTHNQESDEKFDFDINETKENDNFIKVDNDEVRVVR